MRRIITILFILSLIISCDSENKNPDILFIAVDDLNDWVNCLGGREGVFTPNLDHLAGEGMLFKNAHCTAPACCPSRTSVMTGVRPSTSGIYANKNEWRKSPVLANAKTIPEYFREQGYAVKGAGKIFHALSWIRHAYGIDQNDPDIWDEYWPSKSRQLPDSYWPEGTVIDSNDYVTWPIQGGAGTENRPSHFFDYGALGEDELMADHKVVNWAIEQLKSDHDQPLFLAVGIFRPHIPWFVPQKYFDLYPIENVKLPDVIENDLGDVSEVGKRWLRRHWQDWMLENDQWRYAVQAYCASISFADAQLGRLMKGLEESGRADNTIVVLWSDHGMHIGEKEQWEKFTLWEESTRVPLILKAPGVTHKSGSVSNEAVSLLDIFPTLVDLSGGQNFDQLEGSSLLPLLENPESQRDEPAITTFHFNNHSVRTERWRYIRYNNGDEELYDHQNDSDEYHNLAKNIENRELMDELARWLPDVNYPEK